VTDDLETSVRWMLDAASAGKPLSIGYQGNIVDLLEYLDFNDISVDLYSDQTSCHVPYDGGYTPAGMTFDEGRALLASDREGFAKLVDESLVRHFHVLQRLTEKGAHFWDYGNAFMKAVFDAGASEITKNGRDTSEGFIWPSYVEDIMGPMCFDYGYGPFRWVCLSGKAEDLGKTDAAAMGCIDPDRRGQDRDNWQWISDAEANALVTTPAAPTHPTARPQTSTTARTPSPTCRTSAGPAISGWCSTAPRGSSASSTPHSSGTPWAASQDVPGQETTTPSTPSTSGTEPTPPEGM